MCVGPGAKAAPGTGLSRRIPTGMNTIRYHLERPFRGVRFRLTRRLPQRDPCEVWPGLEAAAVTLRPFAGRFGNVKRYELMVLCAVAKHTAARRLFEFGTFDGLTTWHLAANSPEGARVRTLDLPLDHPARGNPGHDRRVGKIHGVAVGGRFAGTPEAGKVEQLYADSLQFDPGPYRGQVDFCFIDAGHGYEHVACDTANALVMVRPGGAIFWHDYSRWWPGVQRCLDELAERVPVFHVPETALAAVRLPG
jgi:hypothetical protein